MAERFEDQIRDELALRLELLEPGLKLIATNYHLSNSTGTRGFIDILARDRNQSFVVIELKRSNKSAREALHEVLKYKELLQREKGIDPAEITSMIVSTEWDELWTPFSRLKRSWDSSIRGFRLTLEPTGNPTPTSAAEVSPQEAPQSRGLTPVHVMLSSSLYSTISVPETWRSFTASLSAVGVDDIIGFELRHEPEPQQLLYIVLGTVPQNDPRTTEFDYLLEELPDGGVEVPDGYATEYRALTHCLLNSELDVHHETGHPDKLGALLSNGGWQVASVLRTGVFARQVDLYPDEEVKQRALDSAGQSDVKAQGTARLPHKASWAKARGHLRRTLFGNDEWGLTVSKWLEEAEASNGSGTELHYYIYNPCDFVTSLVYGWPDELTRYMPSLTVGVKGTPEGDRLLQGVMVWDGVAVSPNVTEVVKAVYSRITNWHLERSMGIAWESDLDLLSRLGLSYRCFEFADGRPSLLDLRSGKLVRIAPTSDDHLN